MQQDKKFFVSGLWSGSLLYATNENQCESIIWSLALTANGAAYPSAFGLCFSPYQCVLHGEWDASTKKLTLTEVPCEYVGVVSSLPRTFSCKACIDTASGNLVLTGTWAWCEGNSYGGTLALALEPDDATLHISGLFLGQAEPATELTGIVPVNPISWSLTLLTTGEVWGAGYFDDSADVANQPLLFYSLHGSWVKSTGSVHLTKHYEGCSEAADYVITYEGNVTISADNSWWIQGAWDNTRGNSNGSFSCRKQHDEGWVSFRFLCRICLLPIRPGDTRWCCTSCVWNCCGECHKSRSFSHPHSLISEPVYDETCAMGQCCAELIMSAFHLFADRPFIGIRANNEQQFSWLTYSEYFVSGLKAQGFSSRQCILFYADIDVPYVVSLLGALCFGLICVPIHAALEPNNLAEVFKKTSPCLCIVGSQYLERFLSSFTLLPSMPKVPVLVSRPDSYILSNETPILGCSGAVDFTEFLKLGKKQQIEITIPNTVNLDDISAVLFTSGSTGCPKGASYTEHLLLPTGGDTIRQPFVRLDFQPFHPSFLVTLLFTMHVGGRRAFAKMETVLEDAKLVQPTNISASPVFWNMLYHNFKCEVEIKKRDPKLVAAEHRDSLGGRLVEASTGGAPVSPEVVHFARDILHIDLINLYGCREAGGISRDGCLHPGVEAVVLPVTELQDTKSDSLGEICVHSDHMIPGYFNDDGATSKAFVTLNGVKYYRTGDIGEIQVRNGIKHIQLIDRFANFLKLAQGEWVCPGKVEDIIEQSTLIKHAFVAGNTSQRYLVCIAVPADACTKFWQNPLDPTNIRYCSMAIMDEIRFHCAHAHLRPVEFPQAVYLDSNDWDAEGLLTSTQKKCRPRLSMHYKTITEELYKRPQELIPDSEISQYFLSILKYIIPIGMGISGSSMFYQIGGDSLATARLVSVLKNEGLDVSSSVIHSYTLGHLSKLLTSAKSGLCLPHFSQLQYSWQAECQLPSNLPVATTEKQATSSVLLTGATGFLGLCLLVEAVLHFPETVKVICLVRTGTKFDIKNKLHYVGVTIPAHKLQPDRICVVEGDLEKDKLGMEQDQYRLLVNNVSDIIHCAAKVDMTLPYAALRAANVEGTSRIIQLALEAGARLHYVSSVAALPYLTSRSDEDWVTLSTEGMEGKNGYGQSKAVAERMLLHAHQHNKLNIRVFRPSTISCHTLSGYCNPKDFTTLLLRACLGMKMGVFCQFPLQWVPVDFVSKAVLLLADSPSGTVFNLSAKAPYLDHVLSHCVSLGHQINAVSSDKWRAEIFDSYTGRGKELFTTLQFSENTSKLEPHTIRAKTELEKRGLSWFSGSYPSISQVDLMLKSDSFSDL